MMLESPTASLLLATVGGAGIGVLYFAALWWTVRRIPTARNPAILMVGSFLTRTALAAGGIVVVAAGKMVPLVGAMAGFLVGRTILVRIVGKPLRDGRIRASAESGTVDVPGGEQGIDAGGFAARKR